MRLFIAINLNDEIKKYISELIKKLSNLAVNGSFSLVENLHLTLVFIGETKKVGIIEKCINDIKAEPFKLMTGRIGSFKRQDGDIYWLGIEKNEILNSIQNSICQNLRKAGFNIECGEYKPHLTLGRHLIFPDKQISLDIQPMEIYVDEISLMKSEKLSGRLTYTEIYKKALR